MRGLAVGISCWKAKVPNSAVRYMRLCAVCNPDISDNPLSCMGCQASVPT